MYDFNECSVLLEIDKKNTSQYLKNFKSYSQPCVIIDLDGSFLHINNSLIKLFGAKNEKTLRKRKLSHIYPDFQPHFSISSEIAISQVVQSTFEAAQNEERFVCEWIYRDCKGGDLSVSISSSSISLSGKIAIFCELTPLVIGIGNETNKTKTKSIKQEEKLKKNANEQNFEVGKNDNNQRTIPDFDQSEKDNLVKLEGISKSLKGIEKLMHECGNNKLENDVVENLTFVEREINILLNSRLNQIHDLSKKLLEERKIHKKKYSCLEQHLQRRMGNIDSQKQEKRKMLEENLKMKNKIFHAKKLTTKKKLILEKSVNKFEKDPQILESWEKIKKMHSQITNNQNSRKSNTNNKEK
ncbi:hypothetical protein M0813_24801 [Anaeramoeba flamelloides]|uniref:PAS domain-containing protein n=1 Tax=Anaeramoeba flamelloides TaxID=1746091 RepID=A0ABQ8Y532_9EUKA|nr:hypothetical protein M0813_24801 [Anaeramoeba flamelloides]